MEKNTFETSPFYGFISNEFTRFNDFDIFDKNINPFILLKKVKLWYGKYKVDGNEKSILGIQCEYKDIINGTTKRTDLHCGSLESDDIIVKELGFDDDDCFQEFHICFHNIIFYLKFISRKGKVLEIGEYDKDFEKTIGFINEIYPHIINYFYGYYDSQGLRALGCKHINRKNYLFFNLTGVFRLRHKLKLNIKEKEKWENEEKIKELDFGLQAVLKMCLLPDNQFFSVVKYCY